MRKKQKSDNTTILVFALLGAGAGFFIADYLKEQEIKQLKAKIQANPSELSNILKESGGILKTLQDIFGSSSTKQITV